MDPPNLAAEVARYPPGALLKTVEGGEGGAGAIAITSYRDETQLESIMALIRKDLSEPYSVFTYRRFVHGWPHFTLLAHAACGRLVGAVICKSELRPRSQRVRGYVAMLAVDKEFRRAGLGRLLAVEVLHRMAASCDELCLETEVTNAPALRLYESLGFVRDKRLVRYYMNGNDAFRFKCALRSGEEGAARRGSAQPLTKRPAHAPHAPPPNTHPQAGSRRSKNGITHVCSLAFLSHSFPRH